MPLLGVTNMDAKMNSFSNTVTDLYKELESLKTITFKQKSIDNEQINSRVNELAVKVNQLKSTVDQCGIANNKEITIINEQINTLTSSIENLKAKLPTVFKAQAEKDVRSFFRKTYDAVVDTVVNLVNQKIRGFCFIGATTKLKNENLSTRIAAEKNKLAGMTGESAKVQANVIEALEAKLEKLMFHENKGDEMRQSFTVLGGERVQIKTSDNTKLDGMYLDAKAFRKTLKESGCELITLNNKLENQPDRQIQMISMTEEQYKTSGKEVFDALKKLKAFSGVNRDAGAGWTIVREGRNILFVRSDELPEVPAENQLQNHPLFEHRIVGNKDKKQSQWFLKADSAAFKERTTSHIDDSSPASGTVILSSGNAGLYEQHKSEALSYLFKNMNVVLFNFRGYGKSEGDPTEKGLKLDMEAAYQMGKAKSGHKDQQILFKALCMSGGPAAYVAAQHPETNILLDQSYSDFKTLLKESTQEALAHLNKSLEPLFGDADPKSLKGQLLGKVKEIVEDVAPKVIEYIAPDFNSAKALAANNGQKAIFYTHDDKLINFKHVEKNITAVAGAGKMNQLMVIAGPGSHGTSLLEIEAAPYEFINNKYQEQAALLVTLNETNTSLHDECERKVTEMQEKADQLENQGHKTQADKIKDEVEEIKNQYDEKRKLIRQNIDEISAELSTLKDHLSIDLGLNATKRQHTANNQIGNFLDRIGISSDIIKSDTQLKRSTESPMDRSVRNMNKFINEVEDLKVQLSKAGIQIPPGDVVNVNFEAGVFNFVIHKREFLFTITTSNPEIVNFSISKDEIDNQINHLKKIMHIDNVAKELQKDVLSPIDEHGQARQLINTADRQKFDALKDGLIKLLSAIDIKAFHAERHVEERLEIMEGNLSKYAAKANEIQENIQGEIGKLKEAESEEKTSGLSFLINKASDQINFIDEQIESLAEMKSHLENLIPLKGENAKDQSWMQKMNRVNNALSSLVKEKQNLQNLSMEATNVIKVIKVKEKIIAAKDSLGKHYNEVDNGLVNLVDTVQNRLKQFDEYYHQYSAEEWKNYLQDPNAETDETLIAWRSFIEVECQEMEIKMTQFKNVFEGNQSIDTIYASAVGELESIKEMEGFKEWRTEFQEYYNDVLETLFAAGHPDIFPDKDVALQTAVGHALGLESRPPDKLLAELAGIWSPWRGIAARLFWAYYRTIRGRDAVPIAPQPPESHKK